MVLTAPANAVLAYQDGLADRTALVALRNVTTGDTLNVGLAGLGVLQVINRAVLISVTSFVEIACNWAGTVVTMPAGLSTDAAYLLLWGSGVS